MDQQELSRLFYLRLQKIHHLQIDEKDRLSALYQFLNRIFFEFTKDENLQFTTAYARIAYACHKFKFDTDLQWRIQYFRKLAQRSYYKDNDFTYEEYLSLIHI